MNGGALYGMQLKAKAFLLNISGWSFNLRTFRF